MHPQMVIIGDLAYEKTIIDCSEHTSIGGSAFYAAVGAKASKNDYFIVIASVGNDFTTSAFDSYGISREGITFVPNKKTASFTTTFVKGSDQRSFLADWGAINAPNFNIIIKYLDAEVIFLAGSNPQRQLRWINILHKLGYTGIIACDVFEQYCSELYYETINVISNSDIVFMNESEKALLHYNPYMHTKTSIIKLGANGAVLIDKYGTNITISPQLSCIAIDTNGAGDILASSFLSMKLAGHSDKAALQFAVNLATLSVSDIGVDHIMRGKK